MVDNTIGLIPRATLEGILSDRVRRYFQVSRPRTPDLHLVTDTTGETSGLLLPQDSRVFRISSQTADRLAETDDPAAELRRLGIPHGPPRTYAPPVVLPRIQAISLAIAQKCNLGCLYCYAQGGEFGGEAQNMSADVARGAVDMLLEPLTAGETANIAFLGGEPLINRRVLRETTVYAAQKAQEQGVRLCFSITTNGTLLTPEDGDFFEAFGFAVTVSIDGIGEDHDRQRGFKNGSGSYQRIIERVHPLLARQRAMQISARVTVTPDNLHLPETLDALIALGFHSVGFSPMLASPTGIGQMARRDLARMLEQMICCGERFEDNLKRGERYPFSNMVNALREIHQGSCRPYPCGAGVSYLGVAADGQLAACHRFIGEASAEMGSVDTPDVTRRSQWQAERLVERQEPCQSCWARYYCGGGCHHEVIHRGRPACDYIRGWLHYCLEAYLRLSKECPDWFEAAESPELS